MKTITYTFLTVLFISLSAFTFVTSNDWKVKEAKIDFACNGAGGERTFTGRFTVVPKEFNITKSGTPDHVDISLKIPVTK